jgi:hypothetical protein
MRLAAQYQGSQRLASFQRITFTVFRDFLETFLLVVAALSALSSALSSTGQIDLQSRPPTSCVPQIASLIWPFPSDSHFFYDLQS